VRTALVGRDRELGVLLGCLDEAQRGHANLVVCVGEPGIGKTRLVEELTGQARGPWSPDGMGSDVDGRRAAVLAVAGSAAGTGSRGPGQSDSG